MRTFMEPVLKQPLSREPKGYSWGMIFPSIPVDFNGVPPLSQETVSEQSRTDRVQRNLNLGGNTDV